MLELGVEGCIEVLTGCLYRTNSSWSARPWTCAVFSVDHGILCLHRRALHLSEKLFKVNGHYKSSKLTRILTQIYSFNAEDDIPAHILRAGYIFLGCSFKS